MGNQIAKNTLFLYFRLVFLMLIAFYTSRKLLELLGVDDFGIYNVVGSIVAIFGSIKGLMTSSTQRYLNFEMGSDRTENISKVFSMSVIIHVILSVLFFVIVEIFGLWYIENKLVIEPSRLSAAYYVFHFSLLTVVISILTVPYDALIIAHEKMKIYAYISIIDGILKILMIFVLLETKSDYLIQYALSVLIISFLIRAISSIYCRRAFKQVNFRLLWDSLLFKDMLSFSSWQFLGNSSFALQSQGLNMMLNFFYGPALNTVRGLSLQVLGAIQNFTQNLLIASNPQIVKLYAKKDYEGFLNLILKVSKYSFYLIFLMTIPFFMFTDLLLSIWLKEVPDYLVLFIQFSLLYSLVRVFHNPLDSAIKATGKIKKYQLLDSCCLLLSLPLAYFFLYYGLNPVFIVISMIISEIITLFTIVFISKDLFKLETIVYFRKVLLPAIFCITFFAVLFAINQIYYINSDFLFQLIYVCFIYILLVLFIWSFGIEKEDKSLIISKILNRFK